MADAMYDSQLILDRTADVVAAYVRRNPVPVAELPALIGKVHTALHEAVTGPAAEAPPPQKPAVPIKKSVTPDFLISLEDGRKLKSLRRHLSEVHGMTPDEYRTKWGLPSDYPMVAPNYAASRSEMAKRLGLGRKPKAPKTKGRGRKARAR